ncbi:FAD-binding oxidoreductase [Nakamurella flavida]|uniref:FAD-binding oxidoreductase n=1 Tax=Nakamurella flavida TaxID=363630 RepID=A0A938YKX3_9ACTN|nr:FAD-binding oxidoreductase [Nakamurella flavida]MBM9475317.1 FAD-binding oxidoreductase [Nakamurella flavida]MDP9776891.1 FAD/FMN-containing dehydrogenase [Nakamurella flavida]
MTAGGSTLGRPTGAASPPRLTGEVVRPGDEAWGRARTPWNLLVTRRPAAVVFAGSTADVVHAVDWARRTGTAFRIRSGRHSLEGWSSLDGGLVIDVSRLKSVDIDPVAGTATLGAGLTQLEAVAALGAHGLAAPTGTEGSVGLAGATLGGGFGLLTRAFGMACDNLLAVEIVVADDRGGARTVHVDESHSPDLLWALRGAGNGSLGVVTALTYRVHPVSQAATLVARWPGLAHLSEVLEVWQGSAPAGDPRLTSQLEVRRDEVVLIAALVDGTAAEAIGLLADLVALGDPEVTTTQGSWADLYADLQIPLDAEPANWKFASQIVRTPLPPTAIAVVGEFMAAAPTAACNWFANAFGGALPTAEPSGGAAFAHRDALFYAEPGAGWGRRGPGAGDCDADARETTACLTWVAEFSAALAPYVDGAYINVPNPEMADAERAYWGANVDRLRRVKTCWDPHDVFSSPQAVGPLRPEG